MIDKNVVTQLVDEWLSQEEDKNYFLVSVTVSPDDRIVIEIDHQEGVWIDDCVKLSRFVEEHLDREKEDFELEVGSAGLGQPFKVWRQYANHVGKEVECLTADGRKLRGTLTAADELGFRIEVPQKVKGEGDKRPRTVMTELPFAYNDVKYTKYLISFK